MYTSVYMYKCIHLLMYMCVSYINGLLAPEFFPVAFERLGGLVCAVRRWPAPALRGGRRGLSDKLVSVALWYVCKYVCMYVCMHAFMHIRMYIYIYTYLHVPVVFFFLTLAAELPLVGCRRFLTSAGVF